MRNEREQNVAGKSLTQVRHELHRAAERSGHEERTARLIHAHLQDLQPDSLVTELGGHGLAAIFDSGVSGPTVLLRSDMDALPIPDSPALPHHSNDPDTAHKCGHDGHMAMLLGCARHVAKNRPGRGRVVHLFQPAEETGGGARCVIEDPKFADLSPDRVLALHNLPGFKLGRVILRDGSFASASRGMIIELEGISSHAAEPESGRSPVLAASALAPALLAAPQACTRLQDIAQLTVVGIEVGGPAFGTSPGRGRVMATLRAYKENVMQTLADYCTELAHGVARAHGLTECRVSWTEEFPATVNDARVCRVVQDAAEEIGLDIWRPKRPFAWSEDFGHFTKLAPGALFGLGAGIKHPSLHHRDYDFPDELLPKGTALFNRCLEALLADELPEPAA